MLKCLLCQDETCYVSNFCPDCETIKRIVNVYGKLEVKEILPLSEGATVFLTKGKHSGDVGTLKKLNVREAIFSKENKDVGTAKGYLFVVGKNKPAIKIN